MLDWLKAHLPEYISMPVILLILIFVGVAPLTNDLLLNARMLQIVQGLPLLKITAIAILSFLAMALCYILLYRELIKKPDFKDYNFNPSDGSWCHKTKQEWLCAAWKVDSIFSPLAFESGSDMICPKCGKTAKNHKAQTLFFMNSLSPKIDLKQFEKEKQI